MLTNSELFCVLVEDCFMCKLEINCAQIGNCFVHNSCAVRGVENNECSIGQWSMLRMGETHNLKN